VTVDPAGAYTVLLVPSCTFRHFLLPCYSRPSLGVKRAG
jgi:hypothetical protein